MKRWKIALWLQAHSPPIPALLVVRLMFWPLRCFRKPSSDDLEWARKLGALLENEANAALAGKEET